MRRHYSHDFIIQANIIIPGLVQTLQLGATTLDLRIELKNINSHVLELRL
jgi:hypothetical protein